MTEQKDTNMKFEIGDHVKNIINEDEGIIIAKNDFEYHVIFDTYGGYFLEEQLETVSSEKPEKIKDVNSIEIGDVSYEEALRRFIAVVNSEIDDLSKDNLRKVKTGKYVVEISLFDIYHKALENNIDEFVEHIYENFHYVVRFSLGDVIYIYRL